MAGDQFSLGISNYPPDQRSLSRASGAWYAQNNWTSDNFSTRLTNVREDFLDIYVPAHRFARFNCDLVKEGVIHKSILLEALAIGHDRHFIPP